MGRRPGGRRRRLSRELASAAQPEDHGRVPRFDVLMLGVGPDGHVASIFPESPAAYDERPAVAVHGAPKPPPTRISLTFRSIGCATEVWLATTGEEKADAVAMALAGADPCRCPPPARTGGPARCGCSTGPRPAGCRHRWSGCPSRDPGYLVGTVCPDTSVPAAS